jgi:CRP/FNR family transcriptional regulator
MRSAKTKEFLKSIELFEDLRDDELEALLSICEIKRCCKSEILFYEKEELDSIYYLINGSIKLYKVDRFENEIFLNKLFSNSFIYTVSNLSTSDYLGVFYTAEFLEESEVLKIDVEKFKELFLCDKKILSKLLQESYKSILQLHCIINRDIVYDGTAKVAHMLSKEIETFNSLKKHEIAYMLHIQPETLSRILKKLTRNKIIEIEKNKVKILNIEELKKIYE